MSWVRGSPLSPGAPPHRPGWPRPRHVPRRRRRHGTGRRRRARL